MFASYNSYLLIYIKQNIGATIFKRNALGQALNQFLFLKNNTRIS
jgi:hypothetical protein